MKNKIFILFFLVGGFSFIADFSPVSVSAFTIEKAPAMPIENDFVVGPAQNEIFLEPGETITKYLSVTSRLGKEAKFVITIEDFVGSKTGETSAILLGDQRGPYSLKDYLEPETREFALAHGDKINLPIKISVPKDAEPGGRYGAILVSTLKPAEVKVEEGQAGGGISVAARIAVLYFVRVKGPVNESGFFRAIRMADGKKIYNRGPFSFELLFENNGNVHLDPYGIIEIKNIAGRKIAEIELDPWFAMPNSLRSRKIDFERNLLLGRYTATAKINRGYQNIIDEKSVSFWVLPWQIVLPVIIGIALILLICRWFVSKFEIRLKKKA